MQNVILNEALGLFIAILIILFILCIIVFAINIFYEKMSIKESIKDVYNFFIGFFNKKNMSIL